jgi:Flp pilus assembly protein TadD
VAIAGDGLRFREIARLDRQGGASLDRGDAAGALEHFRRLTRLDPRNGMGHMNEAIALAYLGRDREAGEAFARAASLAPANPAARQNHGRWFLRVGRLAEAEAEIEAALRLAPHDETMVYDLARIRLREGREPEAMVLLARARELNPGSVLVRDLLEEIEVPR